MAASVAANPGVRWYRIVSGLIIWALWVLIFRLPAVLQDARTRAEVVKSLRRESELARLRSNLHPHFLLNVFVKEAKVL